MQKTITLRLPEEEYIAFHTVCREKGYSKTGKIRELIRELVKKEIETVRVSASEWAQIEEGIREIDRGEFISFGRLKDDVRKRRLENRKNRPSRS